MTAVGNTRKRLLDATMHLMWRDGYGAVGVDLICRTAQVNKGSFYHHFRSKEDLAVSALEATWEMADHGIYRIAFDPQHPPLERINRLAEMTYGFHHGHGIDEWEAEQGCPFGNLGAETGVANSRIRETVQDVYEREAAYFRGALTDAVTQGHIPDQDVGDTARTLVALQTGLLSHGKIYNDIGWFKLFIPTAAGIIGAGVEPRPGAGNEATSLGAALVPWNPPA